MVCGEDNVFGGVRNVSRIYLYSYCEIKLIMSMRKISKDIKSFFNCESFTLNDLKVFWNQHTEGKNVKERIEIKNEFRLC